MINAVISGICEQVFYFITGYFLDARYPQIYAAGPRGLFITYSFCWTYQKTSKNASDVGQAEASGEHAEFSLCSRSDPGPALLKASSHGPKTVIPCGEGCPVCFESSCRAFLTWLSPRPVVRHIFMGLAPAVYKPDRSIVLRYPGSPER